MSINPDLVRSLIAVAISESTSFVSLAGVANLDPSVDFRGALLCGVNFRNDDLTAFDFTGADLSGANLSHAKGLSLSRLVGVKYDTTTQWPDMYFEDAIKRGGMDIKKDAVRRIALGQEIPSKWAQYITELDISRESINKIVSAPPGADESPGGWGRNYMPATDEIDMSLIRYLYYLRSLKLARSPIENMMMISELKNIEELDLSETSIDDLRPLCGLSQLKSLDLTGTNVSDLSPLSYLTNLRQIWISKTRVSCLGPLGTLGQLKAIRAADTEVHDLSPLAGLRALEVLEVPATNVTDLRPLSSLNSLRRLDIRHTGVTDLQPISALVRLTDIERDGSSAITNIIYQHFM